MLSLIRVRDLAVIEDVSVELCDGLNVLTGETGSGKSMIIKALKLVAGGKGSADLVRTGAERAEVEAVFDITHQLGVQHALEAEDFEGDAELIVRRTITRAGRSRVTLNGRLATLAQVQRVMSGLLEICGQRESYGLVDRATHLDALDRFAGLQQQRVQLRLTYQQLRDAAQSLEKIRESLANRGERIAFLQFQLAEIDAVNPQPGEEKALREQAERLGHAEQISTAVDAVQQGLVDQDDAVCATLSRLEQRLLQASTHEPRLQPFVERLGQSRCELEDLARDLVGDLGGIDADEGALEAINERLHSLERLLRRYEFGVDGLLTAREQMQAELEALDGSEERLDEAKAAHQQLLGQAQTYAQSLSEGRKAKADGLSQSVTEELHGLGMGAARVEVALDTLSTDDGQPRLTVTGIDQAEFLIAPNPGEHPRPLRKIASGGELSRALLALRCVLRAPCLQVFDEVDTGVGGAVAEAIGRKLEAVAAQHQVLCITHLPQVAAQASHHVLIEKSVRNDRTVVTAQSLSDQQRREELARMMGGIEVTAKTRQAATEMLTRASALRE